VSKIGRVLALLLAATLLLSACGTKGPLYMPRPGADEDNPRQRR